MKTVFAVLFVFVLQFSARPDIPESVDTLYSHFRSVRMEADSGKLFMYVCTLTIMTHKPSPDTGMLVVNYFKKQALDTPVVWFKVNRDILQASPCTDTIFIDFKQPGALTGGSSGLGMRIVLMAEKKHLPYYVDTTFLMQPHMDTIIFHSSVLYDQNMVPHYDLGALSWVPMISAVRPDRHRTQSSSIRTKRAYRPVDLMGRTLPANRPGLHLVVIDRTGAAVNVR